MNNSTSSITSSDDAPQVDFNKMRKSRKITFKNRITRIRLTNQDFIKKDNDENEKKKFFSKKKYSNNLAPIDDDNFLYSSNYHKKLQRNMKKHNFKALKEEFDSYYLNYMDGNMPQPMKLNFNGKNWKQKIDIHMEKFEPKQVIIKK